LSFPGFAPFKSRAVAFRLSNARPGSHTGTASIYLLHAGKTRARLSYRHHLGLSGCVVGAGFGWHSYNLLYESSDSRLVVLNTLSGRASDLSVLARTLPHRTPGERAEATWRSDFHR
jgi:hypothetical protein